MARLLHVGPHRVAFDEEARQSLYDKPGCWCLDGEPIAEGTCREAQQEIDEERGAGR